MVQWSPESVRALHWRNDGPSVPGKMAFAFLFLLTVTAAQNCDNSGVASITSDVTNVPATLSDAASQSASAFTLDLTEGTSGSFGGLFLDTPTSFQGPGGFSTKFSIVNSGESSGDAWEFIVAGKENRAFGSPPFGPGETSYQVAGWSRLNALVIEFDAFNSGSSEQDNSADHISVFLAGVEDLSCQYELPSGVKFSDGKQYTFWIDFSGFNTQLEIRMATDASTRPSNAVTTCSVDVWGTLDIATDNYVGFSGYNSLGGSDAATILSLAETIYVSDARRPEGTDDCAVFTSCGTKSVAGLCTPSSNSPDTCSLEPCENALQWDLSGEGCCAFVERGSFQAEETTGSNSVGDVVPCSLRRNTITSVAESSRCTSPTEPSTTTSTLMTTSPPILSAANTATTAVTTVAGTTTTVVESVATETGAATTTPATKAPTTPTASTDTTETPSSQTTATVNPTAAVAEQSPSPSPSVFCGPICGDEIAKLDCSLSTLDDDIATAQALPCIDEVSGSTRTCACSGFDGSAFVGAAASDPSDNTNFSDCIADSVQAEGALRTGVLSNVFIKSLTADGSTGIFLENDVSSSKICTLDGNSGTITFQSIDVTDTTFNEIVGGTLEKHAGSSYTNVFINFISAFSSGLRFTVDSAGSGGTVTYANMQFQSGAIIGPRDGACFVEDGVDVFADADSTVGQIFFFGATQTCPPMFNA